LLKDYDVEELAKRLDSVWNWHRIADGLGLSDDEKRSIEARAGTVGYVPTVEMLRLWRMKKRSTVRILRQLLVDKASDEFVRELDDLRMSKYS